MSQTSDPAARIAWHAEQARIARILTVPRPRTEDDALRQWSALRRIGWHARRAVAR